jgi:hypothetical protein
MISILLALLLSPQNATDLSTVLSRATEYVSQYEAELGNLIGAEEYADKVWLDSGNPPELRKERSGAPH